ncbi:sulfotransferase [Coleofasciculus sp. G2-EDA-02]|uniref:sulfotransferase n=1 Tax=Coleofasciculus sp. G2-EDA-02 TaxID=3069529 RepID=UPI0032FED793
MNTNRVNKLKERLSRKLRKFSWNFREAPPLKRPVFIVGTVRSGTSIFAKCLGEHPNLIYPRYRHFELTPEWCDLAGIDMAAVITKRHKCPPLKSSDATDNICEQVRQGFAKILVEEGGNKNMRFVNKNPHLWNKLPFLQAIFPDANLVIISRDIYSTVASTKRLFIANNTRHGLNYYLPPEPQSCWRCIFPGYPD